MNKLLQLVACGIMAQAELANLMELLPAEARAELAQLPPEMQQELLNAVLAMAMANRGEADDNFPTLETSPRNSTDPEAPARAAAAGADARWHGLAGSEIGWAQPKLAAGSTEEARPGYEAYDASEYLDSPAVLKAKAKMLAAMWKRSGKDTVIYTGAGLSTASGIGDYASKASSSVAPHKGKIGTGSRLELKPTLAHHCLASIGEKGLIGNAVQQNHDRLLQKAGFPQSKLNEIHGAWGDMKNQVKMMDDTLRKDLLQWLVAWSERAKMCVTLGTSLCGMNADQVPSECARRYAQSQGEGLVIIGLQRTIYDKSASLRIWGLCDEVMALVAKELGCKAPDPKVAKRGAEWNASHPRLIYNTPSRSAKDPM